MPEEAKRRLSDVHPDHRFKDAIGNEIKNLEELFEKLGKMDEEEFRHHVDDNKNDYANWIRDVVKDETLAVELEKTKDFGETKMAVEKRTKELKKRVHMGEIIKKINLFNLSKKKKLDPSKIGEGMPQAIAQGNQGSSDINLGDDSSTPKTMDIPPSPDNKEEIQKQPTAQPSQEPIMPQPIATQQPSAEPSLSNTPGMPQPIQCTPVQAPPVQEPKPVVPAEPQPTVAPAQPKPISQVAQVTPSTQNGPDIQPMSVPDNEAQSMQQPLFPTLEGVDIKLNASTDVPPTATNTIQNKMGSIFSKFGHKKTEEPVQTPIEETKSELAQDAETKVEPTQVQPAMPQPVVPAEPQQTVVPAQPEQVAVQQAIPPVQEPNPIGTPAPGMPQPVSPTQKTPTPVQEQAPEPVAQEPVPPAVPETPVEDSAMMEAQNALDSLLATTEQQLSASNDMPVMPSPTAPDVPDSVPSNGQNAKKKGFLGKLFGK